VVAVGRNNANSNIDGGYFDPHFKRTLWYLIGSTKGGDNRAKILEAIKSQPANDYAININSSRIPVTNFLLIV
jgi:hypothetical protein